MTDYTTWFAEPVEIAPAADAALVVIDLQVGNCGRDGGQARIAREHGGEAELAPRFDRVDEILPVLRELLDAWRAAGLPVVYLVIGAAAADYSDLHPGLRRMNAARGMHISSEQFAVLPDVAPRDGDIVLRKTTMSGFTSCNLEATLRHMGVGRVYLAGMSTDQCVLSTALDASERGFGTYIVDDACGASRPELHADALRLFGRFAGTVVTAGDVLGHLAQLPANEHQGR
jgi:nicotinamidase-related amidase